MAQINGASQIRSATITTTQLSATAGITDGQLAIAYVKADGTRAFSASPNFGGFKGTNAADGTTATDLATFGQMMALFNGRDQKASVRAATTAAGTLASSFANGSVLDGVTLATGDEILIKDQSTASENGIYVVAASGSPTRRSDANTTAMVSGGLTVWVNEGTVNQDTQWSLTTNDPITLGTTGLTFAQSGSNLLQVGGGGSLVKTGNTLTRAALTGDVTASADSNATTIAAAAVSLSKMANLAANSVIANNTGSGATPTALGLTAAATASTAMLRDTNANVKANSVAQNVATTTTAAGTTTLTVGSAQFQQFTGSTTQTVVLPDATTLVTGQSFIIANRSTGAITVNASGGGGVATVGAGTNTVITLIAAGSAAGTWDQGSVASSGLTAANFVTLEAVGGTKNGVNTTFTLANTPTAGTLQLLQNGIVQQPTTDYTLSGLTITWVATPPPASTDWLAANYMK